MVNILINIYIIDVKHTIIYDDVFDEAGGKMDPVNIVRLRSLRELRRTLLRLSTAFVRLTQVA